MKTSTTVLTVIAVIIALGGIYWFIQDNLKNRPEIDTSTLPYDYESDENSTSDEAKSESSQPYTAPSDTSTSTNTVSIDIKNFTYTPNTITVKRGTRVVWTNKDTVAHTVTSNNNNFSSPNIETGKSYSYTFNTIGTYSYYCIPHPNMTANIVVTQ